jgi:hypothetical protein
MPNDQIFQCFTEFCFESRRRARSTEVAARSDWMKARLARDRALGNRLEKNSVLNFILSNRILGCLD